MRKLTNAAQVAKLIKQQAKELGLKVTAKSQNFSMGNSVSVHILSGTDAAVEQLKKDTVKYEYGTFDGMTDSYHANNVREDIPQTKYLMLNDDRAENIIKDNADQTEERFYEHRFTYNNVNCTSYQWLQKLKEEAGENWQNVLKTLLQDLNAAGANSVTTQLNGFVFQIFKNRKEAA